MQAGGVTCDIVPKTTTTWITFTPMPVACVSTVCKLAQRGAWPRLRHICHSLLQTPQLPAVAATAICHVSLTALPAKQPAAYLRVRVDPLIHL